MARFNEDAFGRVLYSEYSKYSYSRIPHLLKGPKYFITTMGLVIRGGQKGDGDLLAWDKIKEPGVMGGNRIAGIDLSGTINFTTPITLLGKDGNKQEFPKMTTSFYNKLMEAWTVANMFSDNKENQEIALDIWKNSLSNNLKDRNILKNERAYRQKVYEIKIRKLFNYDTQKQDALIEMHKNRILKEKDIDEMPIPDIEAKVEEYIKKFKNNSPRNEFRKGLHTDENARGTSDEDGYEEAGNRHRNYEQLEDFPLYGE